MSAKKKNRGGRVLRFAVSGALLVGASGAAAACEDEPEVNEPVELHINEPAPDPVEIEQETANEPDPGPDPVAEPEAPPEGTEGTEIETVLEQPHVNAPRPSE